MKTHRFKLPANSRCATSTFNATDNDLSLFFDYDAPNERNNFTILKAELGKYAFKNNLNRAQMTACSLVEKYLGEHHGQL